MRRIAATPRPDWQKKVEEAGLTWHTGEQPYWNEAAFYEFTAKEVDVLEAATNELETMTLQAAQHVIDNKLYARLAIPEIAVPLIESSWEAEPPSLYGRFDLAYDGVNPPKLLEYNADTPTSLLEAAVVQWYWLQDCFPKRDQFNSLHERLVALWKDLAKYLPGRRIDFCSMDDAEDGMTVTYLQDTAQQAGLEASIFPIDEIGWDGSTFLGPDDQPLGTVFKLYPWEWMMREEFGKHIGRGGDDVDGAAVENAALEQGHSADSVAVVPAASLSAGGQLRRSRTDDGVGEEADPGPRGREYSAPPAGKGRRDRRRLWRRGIHLPADGDAQELRRDVSGDRQLADRTRRRQRGGRDGCPRIGFADHHQYQPVCAASVRLRLASSRGADSAHEIEEVVRGILACI